MEHSTAEQCERLFISRLLFTFSYLRDEFLKSAWSNTILYLLSWFSIRNLVNCCTNSRSARRKSYLPQASAFITIVRAPVSILAIIDVLLVTALVIRSDPRMLRDPMSFAIEHLAAPPYLFAFVLVFLRLGVEAAHFQ